MRFNNLVFDELMDSDWQLYFTKILQLYAQICHTWSLVLAQMMNSIRLLKFFFLPHQIWTQQQQKKWFFLLAILISIYLISNEWTKNFEMMRWIRK